MFLQPTYPCQLQLGKATVVAEIIFFYSVLCFQDVLELSVFVFIFCSALSVNNFHVLVYLFIISVCY